MGIIGIVAAITLSALINNVQKVTYAQNAKKAYLQIHQALSQAAIQNDSLCNMATSGIWRLNTAAGPAIARQMKIVKDCG